MKKKSNPVKKMEWDGSFLPSKRYKIKSKREKLGKVFWLIYDIESKVKSWCLVKKAIKPSFGCLIDELKPLFGLQKVGSHWCIEAGKKYVLYYFRGDVEFFQWDEDDEENIQEEFRRILLFRYIFHLTTPRADGVVYSDRRLVSIGENQSSSKFFFTLSMYQKYFLQKNPTQVLKEMLGVHNDHDLISILSSYQRRVNEVVKRVRPEEYRLGKVFYDRAVKRCRK